MFPMEQSVVLNTVARGMAGQPVKIQGYLISSLLDEEALNKIANSAWDKMWSSVLTFGYISAAVIEFLMVCRGIKLFADTIIHGYTLHSIYGWSIHLIGAIWDSVINLLLHLGKSKENVLKQTKEEISEMMQNPSVRVEINETDTELNNTPRLLYPTLLPSEELNKQVNFELPFINRN